MPVAGIGFVTAVVKDAVLTTNSPNFGKPGSLSFLDAETGELIHRLPIERASPSSPVIVGDRLFIGGGVGALDIPVLLKKP